MDVKYLEKKTETAKTALEFERLKWSTNCNFYSYVLMISKQISIIHRNSPNQVHSSLRIVQGGGPGPGHGQMRRRGRKRLVDRTPTDGLHRPEPLTEVWHLVFQFFQKLSKSGIVSKVLQRHYFEFIKRLTTLNFKIVQSNFRFTLFLFDLLVFLCFFLNLKMVLRTY